MKKVSSICLCLDNYDDEYAWKEAVQDTIFLLLKNSYIMTVREEEIGIVVIDYDYGYRTGISERTPIWLTFSEEESIIYDEERTEVSENE